MNRCLFSDHVITGDDTHRLHVTSLTNSTKTDVNIYDINVI